MQDAQAKSDVRNLVTNVEACYTEQQTYEPCGAPESLSDAGLPLGSGLGQVELQAADAQTYEAAAHSRSGSTFRILKQADGTTKRICAAAGHGGCPANGSW